MRSKNVGAALLVALALVAGFALPASAEGVGKITALIEQYLIAKGIISSSGTYTSPGWDDVLATDATSGANNPTITNGQSLLFGNRGGISASADGIHVLKDTAGTSFGRLCLGGTSSSFPAIKRSSAAVAFRLADDSADASISASGLTLASGISWSSLGTFGPQSDGVFRITDAAATSFGRLQLGGTTSSYPAIKRSSAGVDIRLADDSAYTTLTASNLLGAKGIFTTSGATSSNAVLNANDAAYAGISAILYTGTNSATPDRFQSSSSAGVDYDKRLVLYRTRGTMAAATSATDGDYVGGLVGQILTSNDIATCEVAAISMRAQGTVGNGVAGGKMLFQTTADGGSSLVNRVEINNAGSLIANASGSNLAQNATGGFLYVPVCATGAPSGTPTSVTGATAMVAQGDTLYFRGASTWQALTASAGSSVTLFYGDGSSGSATMDGSTVCFGLTPSGNVYTATANIYATSLTINSGVTLNMANYVLHCSVALTNNGTIHNNGNAASGATGGTALAAAAIGQSFQYGGQSGTTGAGTSAAGFNGITGGIFGAGGGGGRSDGTQQSAGTASTPGSVVLELIRSGHVPFGNGANNAVPGAINYGTCTGQSGRGSGDGTNAGGGSGGSGGLLLVFAKAVTVGASGQFNANGGSGGAGAGGTAGGGGGGGGGAVILYYDSASGTALSGSNVTAAGGSGGAGQGGAGNGTSGVAGSTFIIQRQ